MSIIKNIKQGYDKYKENKKEEAEYERQLRKKEKAIMREEREKQRLILAKQRIKLMAEQRKKELAMKYGKPRQSGGNLHINVKKQKPKSNPFDDSYLFGGVQ